MYWWFGIYQQEIFVIFTDKTRLKVGLKPKFYHLLGGQGLITGEIIHSRGGSWAMGLPYNSWRVYMENPKMKWMRSRGGPMTKRPPYCWIMLDFYIRQPPLYLYILCTNIPAHLEPPPPCAVLDLGLSWEYTCCSSTSAWTTLLLDQYITAWRFQTCFPWFQPCLGWLVEMTSTCLRWVKTMFSRPIQSYCPKPTPIFRSQQRSIGNTVMRSLKREPMTRRGDRFSQPSGSIQLWPFISYKYL